MIALLRKYELWILSIIAVCTSIWSSAYYYAANSLLLYGDAESHLNISKRVIDSLTPGFAQLGGIWLPLPHILLIPFVFFDPLWRSGLAGSIVGGISYVVSAIYIYKIVYFAVKKRFPAVIAFIVFAFNPNILYMQSTALGELTLIAFFILSAYYFLKFLVNPASIPALIMAAFFGFCATLSRYDGWFLVAFEALALVLFFLFYKKNRTQGEGMVILFSTLAFFGGLLWFLWDGLILHDPFYFTNSPFSAKSQQQGWLARGELTTYKNALLSLLYYSDATMRNIGIVLTACAIIGLIFFLLDRKQTVRWLLLLVLGFPFAFYVLTLYLGQSIILIPDLTPASFQWHLFNVRYGIVMMPFAAFLIGYLAYKSNGFFRGVITGLIVLQLVSFGLGLEPTITLEDGKTGLSAMKQPDAQLWMTKHYDHGKVLLDDFARTISIIKSNIPIQNVIYVGNHPYWENALKNPQDYATWVVVQKDDTLWKEIYSQKNGRANLYKYYQKEYTSPEILIFKRNNLPS